MREGIFFPEKTGLHKYSFAFAVSFRKHLWIAEKRMCFLFKILFPIATFYVMIDICIDNNTENRKLDLFRIYVYKNIDRHGLHMHTITHNPRFSKIF